MTKNSFYSKVYQVVGQIPKGKVATYKQIARLTDNFSAARAVGTAMKNNPDMSKVPCHRVVGSDGRMHGYSAGQGVNTKIQMLKKEGVSFIGDKVQLDISGWKR